MATELINPNEPLTMSSREIAELTGKRHPDVKRDIKSMLTKLELGVSRFAHTYFDQQGKEQNEFFLNKDLTLTLVTGYDVARRYKLVQRWQELEEVVAKPPAQEIDFSNPAIVIKVLEAQQAKVQALTVDVATSNAALDELASIEESLTITDAAKLVDAKPKELFAYMRDRSNGWLYKKRRNGRDYGDDIAYQPRLDNGELETKIVPYQTSTGKRHKTQIRITPKGLVKLAKIFAEKRVKENIKALTNG